ncbi:MAG: AsmA family protein [Pseudomonadota bacterium]
MSRQQVSRTLRDALRPIGALAAAGLALFALVAFGAPALVSEDRLRAEIAGHVGDWTGGKVRLRDDAEVSLTGVFPRLGVTLRDAALSPVGETPEWALEAESVQASLEPLSLLVGRVQVADIRLIRPRIDLFDALAAPRPQAWRNDRAGEHDAPRPPASEIVLIDGSLRYETGSGRRAELSGLELRAGHRPGSRALMATAGFRVGEQHVRVEGRLEDPAAAISGAGSRGRLALRLAEEVAEAEAEAPPPPADPPGIAERGDVEIALMRLASRLGLPWGFGPMAVEGIFALSPRGLSISDATFLLDEVRATGDLEAALASRAWESDDPGGILGRVLSARNAAAEAVRAGEWREAPVSLGWLRALDIDLDARAENLRTGSAGPEEVGVRLEIERGVAWADLRIEGQEFGRLRAGFAVDAEQGAVRDGTALTLSGRLDDLSLAEAGRWFAGMGQQPLLGPPRFPDGTLRGELRVSARGGTLGELVEALHGEFAFEAKDGSLPGVDLIQTLEGLGEGREFMTREDGPLIPAAGRTPFETAAGRIEFGSKTATLSRLRISGERYVMDMNGEASLRLGELRIDGRAALLEEKTDGGSASPRVDLPFGIGGTLNAPVVAAGVPRAETARRGRAAGTPGDDRE